MWLVPSPEVSKVRRLVSGAVFKYVCVYLSKEERGGEKKETCVFTLHKAGKMGLVWGRGCDPAGKV